MSANQSSEPESGTPAAKGADRPLDELLNKRSKPFRDWREEREYLRRKWGPQGKRIEPGEPKGDKDPE